MNRFLLTLALATLSALGASAGNVTYSTTLSDLCVGADGCGLTAITFGNTILTYSPVVNSALSTVSFSSLGSLTTSCVGGGTACGTSNLPANLSLYITITESVPGSGSTTLPGGAVTGGISGTSSTAFVDWGGTPSVDIVAGGIDVTYTIKNSSYAIVPPANNNCPFCSMQPSGQTTIQAVVTDRTATPEPGSLLLLSSGLAALAFARKRSS